MIVLIGLFLLSSFSYAEEWEYQDSTYIENGLGESAFTLDGVKTLLAIKAWLDEYSNYEVKEISSGADDTLWVYQEKFLDMQSWNKATSWSPYIDSLLTLKKEEVLGYYEKVNPELLEFKTIKLYEDSLKSSALDGGVITTRNRKAARILGLHSFVSCYLTDSTRQTLIVLGKKDNYDQRLASLENGFRRLNSKVDGIKTEIQSKTWSVSLGWQGVAFNDQQDLSVLFASVQFRKDKFYAEIGGGLDPWARPGYDNCWFRDYLGTGHMGYFVSPNIAFQVGGLVGWEATSDTKANHFTMQVLGITAGLKAEFSISKIGSANALICFSVDYLYAEVNVVNQRIASMDDGVSISSIIKIEL
ncbi:hypothetical protein ACFL1Y_01795 [Patescibacteria group bacterium]